MDRISLGFVLAALYNICIVIFSKGFSGKLSRMTESDFLTGTFYSIYGTGDLVSLVFLGWVAWRHRDRLWSSNTQQSL